MRTLGTAAAIALALGVGCGAFGAHALKDVLTSTDMAIWEKGVLYHLIHGLAALVVLSLSPHSIPGRTATKIALLFLLSVVVFSGSLYLLVLTNQRWLGAITPLGGTGFILGWMFLALTLRNKSSNL